MDALDEIFPHIDLTLLPKKSAWRLPRVGEEAARKNSEVPGGEKPPVARPGEDASRAAPPIDDGEAVREIVGVDAECGRGEGGDRMSTGRDGVCGSANADNPVGEPGNSEGGWGEGGDRISVERGVFSEGAKAKAGNAGSSDEPSIGPTSSGGSGDAIGRPFISSSVLP